MPRYAKVSGARSSQRGSSQLSDTGAVHAERCSRSSRRSGAHVPHRGRSRAWPCRTPEQHSRATLSSRPPRDRYPMLQGVRRTRRLRSSPVRRSARHSQTQQRSPRVLRRVARSARPAGSRSGSAIRFGGSRRPRPGSHRRRSRCTRRATTLRVRQGSITARRPAVLRIARSRANANSPAPGVLGQVRRVQRAGSGAASSFAYRACLRG